MQVAVRLAAMHTGNKQWVCMPVAYTNVLVPCCGCCVQVAATPSSSSVNPFFESHAQCEVAAAVELKGLALLTGYAAVDGLQVGRGGGLCVAESDPLQWAAAACK